MHYALKDCDGQIFFRLEVTIDSARANIGLLGNLLHCRGVNALFRHNAVAGLFQSLPIPFLAEGYAALWRRVTTWQSIDSLKFYRFLNN